MSNVYAEFLALVPEQPRRVGTIASTAAGRAVVTLPGGGVLPALNPAGLAVGQRVYVRAGLIEGPAPVLTYLEQEG